MANAAQTKQMQSGSGFIAALDQSGGSTPKALGLYGITSDAYASDAEMYDLMHAMRARIAQAPAFTGEKVIGAILFEMTLDRQIGGKPSAEFLWQDRGVVPFLKIDKGLEEQVDGVKLMKPIDNLDATLTRAGAAGVFGTKMRSVIDAASPTGIAAIVKQQFEVAARVYAHGLMPIIEPEVTISISDKSEAETILLAEITKQLATLPTGQQVMLKLTLPTQANLYIPLIDHPSVMRVVALSGGYARDDANKMLSKNSGMIASFSRALTEGLSAQQTDAAFSTAIGAAIDSICAASTSN
jgi:fructose-bisphosphate aldolase class I